MHLTRPISNRSRIHRFQKFRRSVLLAPIGRRKNAETIDQHGDVIDQHGEARVEKLRVRQARLTDRQRDEAVAKFQDGWTLSEIARSLGCNRTTIGRLLRARGIDSNPRGYGSHKDQE